MIVLVDLHGFPAHGFAAGWVGLPLVLVLDFLQLRLDRLHIPHGDHLFDEEGKNQQADKHHQKHDGDHPGDSLLPSKADVGQNVMKEFDDIGHRDFDRSQNLVDPAEEALIESHEIPLVVTFLNSSDHVDREKSGDKNQLSGLRPDYT